MADSDKDIVIKPSRGLADEPRIEFTGKNNNLMSLRVGDDDTLYVEGTAGQLFSINNSLEDVLFSVNDVSGIPSIEVTDAGDVRLAPYNGRVIVGGGFYRNGYVFLPDGHGFTSTSNPYIIPDNLNWLHMEEGSNNYIKLPDAASQPGREITIRSWGALYSADNNVVRLADTSASSPDTFIHSSSYYYSKLVSNGTYWIVMESNYR